MFRYKYAYRPRHVSDAEKFIWLLANRVKRVGDCLIWTGALTHRYGNFCWRGRNWQAHRAFYTHFVGDIPDGRQLHHVCLNPACVNVSHLALVTPKEHVAVEPRGPALRTHCPKGHEYTPDNIKRAFTPGANGRRYWKRVCLTCHRADNRERMRRQRHGAYSGK